MFSPLAPSSGPDNQVMSFIYEGLLGVDPDYKLQPRLAESYEVSPDATTFTFKLRAGSQVERRHAVHVQGRAVHLQRCWRTRRPPAPRPATTPASRASRTSSPARRQTSRASPRPTTTRSSSRPPKPNFGLLALIGSACIMPEHILGKDRAGEPSRRTQFFRKPTVTHRPVHVRRVQDQPVRARHREPELPQPGEDQGRLPQADDVRRGHRAARQRRHRHRLVLADRPRDGQRLQRRDHAGEAGRRVRTHRAQPVEALLQGRPGPAGVPVRHGPQADRRRPCSRARARSGSRTSPRPTSRPASTTTRRTSPRPSRCWPRRAGTRNRDDPAPVGARPARPGRHLDDRAEPARRRRREGEAGQHPGRADRQDVRREVVRHGALRRRQLRGRLVDDQRHHRVRPRSTRPAATSTSSATRSSTS